MKKTSIFVGSKAEMPADQTDWAAFNALTDEDIARAVTDDPDTFIVDEEWMKNALIIRPDTKHVVTLRLDPDILGWFKKAGRGYQTRINAVLRAYVEAQETKSR